MNLQARLLGSDQGADLQHVRLENRALLAGEVERVVLHERATLRHALLHEPYGAYHGSRLPVTFTAEAVGTELAHPELIRLGGNTGSPNSFTGIDVDDLTGNVLNAQNLLEGNNLMCLALTAAMEGTPDLLGGLVGNVLVAVKKLVAVLEPVLAALNCPEITKYDSTVFKAFPGAGSAL